MMRGKRRSFTAERKKKVIAYAEKHGNRAAGRQFNVSERNVRQWRKNKAIIVAMPRRKRSMRGGHTKYPELEEALKQYVLSVPPQQKANMVPKDIRKMANQMAQNDFDIKNFQANPSWVFRFIKRHNLNVERRKKEEKGSETTPDKPKKKGKMASVAKQPETAPAHNDKSFPEMFHPVVNSACLTEVKPTTSFIHRIGAQMIPGTTSNNNNNATTASIGPQTTYFRLTNELCRTNNSPPVVVATTANICWDLQQQPQQQQQTTGKPGEHLIGGGGLPSSSSSVYAIQLDKTEPNIDGYFVRHHPPQQQQQQ